MNLTTPLFISLFVGGFWVISPAAAQLPQTPGEKPATLLTQQRLAREAISGERARKMISAMDPSYRLPGNESFHASIYRVVEALEESGFLPEESAAGEETPLTYRIESRPMDRPAWDPVQASVTILGQPEPLLTLAGNINLVAAYSHSTPNGAVEAEVVDVGRGSAEDFERVDVRGKIVLGDGSPGQLFRRAVQEGGALGVMAYRLSSFNRPDRNPDIAAMSSIPFDPDARSWGLALTLNARNTLREALASGPLRVRVEIQTRLYPSEELTLVADVRGRVAPEERFVFSAHVQESGANDNASGVAVLAEIARALAQGVRNGSFTPDRTVTLIWGDEITSTRRYLEEDPVRAQGVRWGLSLDMVGEDTEKTGGTFLIEKMPDPSAVWTRGEDRHTEWGGRPMTVDQLTPHYLNDFVLNRCLEQGSASGWVVGVNPFEGGSDHVPFLRAGVPGILLWHFTDQFYHTDGDRLEMVSAETLENVGVCAAVTAMALTTGDSESAPFFARELEEAALDRLRKEISLSQAALSQGGRIEEERSILKSWTDWYLSAAETFRDLEAGGPSEATERTLSEIRSAISQAGTEALRALGG